MIPYVVHTGFIDIDQLASIIFMYVIVRRIDETTWHWDAERSLKRAYI
jgi:hypothetical protein